MDRGNTINTINNSKPLWHCPQLTISTNYWNLPNFTLTALLFKTIIIVAAISWNLRGLLLDTIGECPPSLSTFSARQADFCCCICGLKTRPQLVLLMTISIGHLSSSKRLFSSQPSAETLGDCLLIPLVSVHEVSSRLLRVRRNIAAAYMD